MSDVRRIDLKVGFSCNNRCRFCVQGDKRDRYPDKDTATLLQALEQGREHADEVVLTGGEVTIRKDLPEIVKHAASLGYRVIQLQTNGRILSAKRAVDKLVAAGVTEFSPALHGPTAEIHDTLTGVSGAFKQTVRGIRNVKAAGMPVITNSVITRANHTLVDELTALLIALGVDQLQLAFVHALGTAGANFTEIVPRLSDTQPYVLKALARARAAGMTAFTEAIPLCFLPGAERHAAEWIIPVTRILDAEHVVENYTWTRLHEAKLKGPQCGECALEPHCEGPWREYPEHFGWEEFVPVEGGDVDRVPA